MNRLDIVTKKLDEFFADKSTDEITNMMTMLELFSKFYNEPKLIEGHTFSDCVWLDLCGYHLQAKERFEKEIEIIPEPKLGVVNPVVTFDMMNNII